ncbi:MAG: Na/Pi cotransporter family protein [Polyangia bacterium]|jgi:phosphate:Na+ symporter|nr:Na/Pi cotransporter family protein [Polyangia bacterium]
MDLQAVLFGTLGGLAIFLFGLTYMSEGLERIGSESLKKLLHTLTRNRLAAVLVGTGFTCLIQSSSATSVIAVGFVNAGLLQLEQAVAVVLGADIGTTITAWIVSSMGISRMNISTYALPIIAVGFSMVFFMKSQKRRKLIGQTILGFGLLFLGLGIMSEGVKSIRESAAVMAFFKAYGPNPFFGIVTGTIFTCIIQSSSATIAIIQVMAFQGIFGLETALPLMLGADIGTTITAQLASIGATKNARGVAMANTLFKTFAVLTFVPLLVFGLYEKAIVALVPNSFSKDTGANTTIMLQIAAAHSAYIIVNVILFSTVLWRALIFFAKKASFIREGDPEMEPTRYLDPLLLKTPPVALEQSVHEVAYMTRQCHKNITAAFEAFMDKDLTNAPRIERREEEIDALQTNITEFLVKLGRLGLTEEESRYIPQLIHCINDAERIGDHAENLMELTQLSIEKKLAFSLDAKRELHNYFDIVNRQFKAVIAALDTLDGSAVEEAVALEKELNTECVALSRNHVERLESGSCEVQAGVIFLDVIQNLEKIGDHLTNIAERVELG